MRSLIATLLLISLVLNQVLADEPTCSPECAADEECYQPKSSACPRRPCQLNTKPICMPKLNSGIGPVLLVVIPPALSGSSPSLTPTNGDMSELKLRKIAKAALAAQHLMIDKKAGMALEMPEEQTELFRYLKEQLMRLTGSRMELEYAKEELIETMNGFEDFYSKETSRNTLEEYDKLDTDIRFTKTLVSLKQMCIALDINIAKIKLKLALEFGTKIFATREEDDNFSNDSHHTETQNQVNPVNAENERDVTATFARGRNEQFQQQKPLPIIHEERPTIQNGAPPKQNKETQIMNSGFQQQFRIPAGFQHTNHFFNCNRNQWMADIEHHYEIPRNDRREPRFYDSRGLAQPMTVKPPTITVPKFHGSKEEFDEYIQTFDELIHRNMLLTDFEKVLHLKNSIKGRAANAIKDIPAIGANYRIMLNIIKRSTATN